MLLDPRRAWRATTRSSRSTRRCGPTSDVAAVVAGLCDGTIDAVATDHAPHAPEAKDRPVRRRPRRACSGCRRRCRIAWEVARRPPRRTRAQLFALLERAARRHRPAARRPTRAARATARTAARSRSATTANLCVVRPRGHDRRWTRRALASRSRNTPYVGRTFAGAVRHTVLRGEPVVIDATAQR